MLATVGSWPGRAEHLDTRHYRRIAPRLKGRREPGHRVRRTPEPNSRDRRSRGSRLVRFFRPQYCGAVARGLTGTGRSFNSAATIGICSASAGDIAHSLEEIIRRVRAKSSAVIYVSIERRSFFILGGLILLLCLSLALIYPRLRAPTLVGSPCTVIDAQMDRIWPGLLFSGPRRSSSRD
jgi:hypothetical protein